MSEMYDSDEFVAHPCDNLILTKEKGKERTMAQVVGKVAAIQADGKGFYKIKVNGNDKWFGTGSKEVPNFNMGQTVELDFDSKPWTNSNNQTIYFHNVKPGTLKVVSAAQEASGEQTRLVQGQSVAQQQQAAAGGQTQKGYWDAKEARDIEWQHYNRTVTQPQIQLQSARNAAVALVAVLAGEKAVPYSEAAGKQKPKDRQAVIETLVDHYTAQFLAETQNFGVPQEVEEESGPQDDVGSIDA